MLLLPAGQAWAQTKTLPVIQSDTSEPRKQPLIALKNKSLWLSKARFSHSTDKGDVYIMPTDNMPCLVPDVKKSARMPMRKLPQKPMPNPYHPNPQVPKGK
jgi:hypothetical protein